MRAARQAVYEWLTRQQAVLDSLSAATAIYANEATGDVELPYLVFTVGSAGQVDEDTGTKTLERRSVRFQVWATRPDDAAQALDLIDEALTDDFGVKMDNTTFAYAGKEDDDLFVEDDRLDGQRVWQGVLQVTIAASRDRRTSVRRL